MSGNQWSTCCDDNYYARGMAPSFLSLMDAREQCLKKADALLQEAMSQLKEGEAYTYEGTTYAKYQGVLVKFASRS